MKAGAFGHVSYYDSQRINLGLFQADVNVLWDLAPHDLSIIDHLFGEEPIYIEASGYCHLNPDVPDIAYVTMHFPSRMVAHLNLSWMSPVKVRRTVIGGTAKMAIWDDLERDEPIRLYDSGINVLPEEQREVIIPGYRIGDVYSPRLPVGEPLVAIAEHFHNVITGKEKVTDGWPQGIEQCAGASSKRRSARWIAASRPSMRITRPRNCIRATRNRDKTWTLQENAFWLPAAPG